MATITLAAGVLGVSGWGIYQRSRRVSQESTLIPLPQSLELISRKFVVAQAQQMMKAGQKMQDMQDLATFFSTTGWVDGATTVPEGLQADTAEISGVPWPYIRLIQASSLNLMSLINDAHARSASPPLREEEIGGPKSPYNLQTTQPQKKRTPDVDGAIRTISLYLRHETPVGNKPPPPGT